MHILQLIINNHCNPCVDRHTFGADYTAKVIAYPIENGQFRSGQQVPLLCIITPTPPFPVVYIWRSSTQNHDLTAIFPSIVPLTTLLISDNHPLFGRYFCHVLSADNHTTLAVGHVTIFPTGEGQSSVSELELLIFNLNFFPFIVTPLAWLVEVR